MKLKKTLLMKLIKKKMQTLLADLLMKGRAEADACGPADEARAHTLTYADVC
jgi:hypothetical protein